MLEPSLRVLPAVTMVDGLPRARSRPQLEIKRMDFDETPITLNIFLCRIRLSTREVPENFFSMSFGQVMVFTQVQFSGMCIVLW